MKMFLTIVLFLVTLAWLPAPAAAYWTSDVDHASVHARGHNYARRTASRGGYTCEWARSVGLFCGCFAARSLGIPVDTYGVYHGINLKRADAWAAFERVSPDRANAVIWPGRHVAHLLSASGGALSIVDNIGARRVKIQRGMIFVNAPVMRGGGPLYQSVTHD